MYVIGFAISEEAECKEAHHSYLQACTKLKMGQKKGKCCVSAKYCKTVQNGCKVIPSCRPSFRHPLCPNLVPI